MKTLSKFVAYTMAGIALSAAPLLLAAEDVAKSMILENVAKTVEVDQGDIVLVTKDKGQRYILDIEGRKPRVLGYKEVVRLKPGFSKAIFKTRDHAIEITETDRNEKRYQITETVDARSGGGELTRSTKRFRLQAGNIVDVEDAQNK